MKIAQSITELVGGTPLVKLQRVVEGCMGEVVVKIEAFNPCGSVKDRPALNMIEVAEREGVLNKDTVLIEPTSGNTGVGLAFVAAAKGYRLILTMPDTMTIERRKILKLLGAELVLTPGAEGMKGAISRAEELKAQHENAVILQQFVNAANPAVHESTTGQEIWDDTDGEVDFFVSGVGTGGTVSGVGRLLKGKRSTVKVIAVEPEDSPVLSGGSPGPHKIPGIGAGFVPGNYDSSVVDEVIKVSNKDAEETAMKAAREEGVMVGISSGAALWAALEVAKRPEAKGKRVVVVLPDTGERYLSVFSLPES
jgi:cysteine synthase A